MRHELWRRVIGLARGCLPAGGFAGRGRPSPALCAFALRALVLRFWFIYPHLQCKNGHLVSAVQVKSMGHYSIVGKSQNPEQSLS